MKKLIISSVLGIMVAASTAFGQGYFNFGGGSRTVWDALPATPLTDTTMDTALFWAASSVTSASVDAIMSTVPTNNTTQYSYATAWTDITTDPNFTQAKTNGVFIVAGPTASNGGFSFNGGVAVPVDATVASTTYSIFVIAWNTEGGTLNSVSAALAAGAPVGWSSVVSYASGAAPPALPPSITGEPKFGVGYFIPVPEPTTLALAGLGGISMLFLRRRKA